MEPIVKTSTLTAATRVETHGARIPVLGFGTWSLESDVARRMVETALEVGYRHVDTAQMYRNERAVGRALESSGVPREEVRVTTKVWPDNYPESRFLDSVERSREKLGLDAIDLLLLHWPRFEGTDFETTIALLNAAKDQGLARHVGVSNFTTRQLARAWDTSAAPLVVNQVEYHPFLDQDAVLAAVRDRKMALVAYSPIAHGKVAKSDRIRGIGERHGRNAVQVTLRWLIQQDGVCAIPRTSDETHCRENFDVFDFELSSAEMRAIADLARPDGRLVDPDDLAPDWD